VVPKPEPLQGILFDTVPWDGLRETISEGLHCVLCQSRNDPRICEGMAMNKAYEIIVGEQRYWDALCGAPDLPEGYRLAKLTLTAHRLTKTRVYWLSHNGETSWMTREYWDTLERVPTFPKSIKG
jgi:hypothetical protein